ncbi:MAG TPA: PfkB family carbohydrate kinase [Candidatus Dormibacteraeota bacterium]|jgi:sugar/nucleoside kinase (ribokinase family)|nr:PfkB family carbohydrate kinase [Candidatus Dormibacteraeota bacterium]
MKPARGVVAVGSMFMAPAPSSSEHPAAGAGGSALLASAGAWLAGSDAAIAAVIGDDVSTDLIRRLTRAGIDLSRCRSAGDSGGTAELEPVAEQLASVSPTWSVHLCGTSTSSQGELLTAASKHGSIVTLDAAPKPGFVSEKEEILELAKRCDAFLASRSVVERLWPGDPPREVLRMLDRAGVRAAVIKLGVGGSIGIQEGRISWMSAFPLARPPLTAGGDAYAGAFAAIFAADRNLARSMAWATATASSVMESHSPLDLLTDFGRRMVESRARVLQADTVPS